MEQFQPSEFSITVNQHSILSNNISSKKAYLILSENIVDINLLDNDCFDYVDESSTRYELVVEYENSSHYDLSVKTVNTVLQVGDTRTCEL